MNLNQFIDYDQSKPIKAHGHQAHIQASAVHYGVTLLLVLQGRATHVKALWARFHEKQLVTSDFNFPRDKGKTYVSPNPVVSLPQGVQMWIIHHDLTTVHANHTNDHFYTFPPPHFGATLAASSAVPMLPHWQSAMFQLGRKTQLIQPVRSYNVDLYTVSRDTTAWLKIMQKHRKELPDG